MYTRRAVCSAVCATFTTLSCKTKYVSALGAKEPEPQISLRCVWCVLHFVGGLWALIYLLARRIARPCEVFGDGKTLHCQGLPRSRNVHACCLLNGVCDVHYSVLKNTSSALGAEEPEPKSRSVCRVLHFWALICLLARRIARP